MDGINNPVLISTQTTILAAPRLAMKSMGVRGRDQKGEVSAMEACGGVLAGHTAKIQRG